MTASSYPAAAAGTLHAALDKLLRLLRAPLAASDVAQLSALHSARRTVAGALDETSAPPPRGPLTDALLAAADALAAHPLGAFVCTDDDAAFPPTAAPASSGWRASLVRLFAAPAWLTSDLRPLADQPAWLWPAYARHLFAAPAFLRTTAHETRWSAHLLAHLEPLARMLETNRGSSSVRAAAQLALAASATWPAVGVDDQLRRRQLIVGRLRSLLAPRLPAFPVAAEGTPPSSPLRVGLLCAANIPAPGIFDATRLKTLLDPERVELCVYTETDLPGETDAQVETLRLARLDAVIFAGDLTADTWPSALALHRVAPRQFATALCPLTTGLAEVDIFLADSAARPTAHTERLATLPAALAFDAPAEEPTLSRAELGLPEDARLLAATVHPVHLGAATRARWRALLDADPRAQLILLPDASGPALDLMFADLTRDFGDRLIIAGNAPLPAPAIAALLRVTDTYLPSSAPGDRFARDLAQRLGVAAPDVPPRIDCLSFADALTTALETACRSPGQTLSIAAAASDLATRHEEGNHLLAFGRADRAVVYLLAAVDDPDAGPEVWHDLALALHANGQPAEAIQALETCVQRAPGRLESWLLLSDWASEYGQNELVRDIAGIVRELAPEDPRVTALAERIAV
jgi:hypothetical protein